MVTVDPTAQASAARLSAGVARGAALLVLIAAALVLPAGPAGAHASLQATSPSDGEELAKPPDEVSLEFNEPVRTSTGAVRVYDSSGEQVTAGDGQGGGDAAVLTLDLPDALGEDTFIVTWRATSADGHPIRGAFLFTVGQAAAAADSVLAQLFAAGDDRAISVAAGLARWSVYASTLLAAGGILFLLRVHRAGPDRRRLQTLVARTAMVAFAATVVGAVLQAALVTGLGLAVLARPSALLDAWTTGFGASSLVRLVGLAAVFAALRTRAGDLHGGRLAGAGGALALLSFLLTGHTVTTEPRWLVMLADAVHLAAAAAWFGGLVLLGVCLRHRRLEEDPVGGATLVARFSTVAAAAIVTVGVAGITLAWLEVRALRALFSTTYGWTLVVKVALFLVVLALGVYNNRRLVPQITAVAELPSLRRGEGVRPVPTGGSTADGVPVSASGAPRRAWGLLRRTIRMEVVGITAVLAATAVLVYVQPAAEAAGVTGAYSTYAELGDYDLNITVDPNRAGTNQIHIYLLDETGRLVDAEGDVTLGLSQPDRELGPIVRSPQPAGPGHWILAGPELAVPGRWNIEVTVGVSRFEQVSTDVPVVVSG